MVEVETAAAREEAETAMVAVETAMVAVEMAAATVGAAMARVAAVKAVETVEAVRLEAQVEAALVAMTAMAPDRARRYQTSRCIPMAYLRPFGAHMESSNRHGLRSLSR